MAGLPLHALHQLGTASDLLRSDRSLSLTQEEKLGFCLANSHVTLSNVTFIGRMLLASEHLYINLCARIGKNTRGIPSKLEIWLVCHGGGGDKIMEGDSFLRRPNKED